MSIKELFATLWKVFIPKPIRMIANVANLALPCSYYTDIKPILYTLRALGRLPVYITDTGLQKCSVFSWPWIYTIVCLTGQIIATLIGLHFIISSLNKSEDYDEYLFWLMLTLILMLNILVPFTYWIDVTSFVKYLDDWSSLQNELLSFSKGPLSKLEFLEADFKSGSRCYIFWMSVINIPFVAAVAIIEIYYVVKVPLIVVFPYVTIFSSVCSSSLYWCSACRQLCRISSVLLLKTSRAIRKDSLEELVWCRKCWIKLSGLTAELGSSTKKSVLANVIVMSVSHVISMYASLAVFSRSLSSDYVIGIVTEIPITLTILLLVFNHSNNATKKVGSEFGSSILSHDLSKLSPASTDEINFFLQSIILSPPIVKLADFVVVDRRLITSFTSNVITYLIVLLQFRDSGSKAIYNYNLSSNHSSLTDHIL